MSLYLVPNSYIMHAFAAVKLKKSLIAGEGKSQKILLP